MGGERVSFKVRQLVAERAGRRCEYCQSPENFSASPFSVEHVIPRSKSGSDDEANLAWSCMGCNDHKYDATSAVDPVTGRDATLFHPRHDRWNEHFMWADRFTMVVGISETGRATVSKLKLNRPSLVNLRRILRLAGEHPAQ